MGGEPDWNLQGSTAGIQSKSRHSLRQPQTLNIGPKAFSGEAETRGNHAMECQALYQALVEWWVGDTCRAKKAHKRYSRSLFQA